MSNTFLYVNPISGKDSNDGLSWQTAKATIGTATYIDDTVSFGPWRDGGEYHKTHSIYTPSKMPFFYGFGLSLRGL